MITKDAVKRVEWGTSGTVQFQIYDDDGTLISDYSGIEFSSSDESVATVDSGGVISCGMTVGCCVITATRAEDGVTASLYLEVGINESTVEAISNLTPSWKVKQRAITTTLDGTTYTEALAFWDADGESQTSLSGATFSSSDTTIATVTSAGVVSYGMKAGLAIITVTSDALAGGEQQVIVLVIGGTSGSSAWVEYTGS